jgi:hypothetical protein
MLTIMRKHSLQFRTSALDCTHGDHPPHVPHLLRPPTPRLPRPYTSRLPTRPERSPGCRRIEALLLKTFTEVF